MNETINRFLLTGDKFMSETHLRDPGFTYKACRSFMKTKKEYKILQKQENQDIFIKEN